MDHKPCQGLSLPSCFVLRCFFEPSLSSDGPLKHLFCSTRRVLHSTPQYCWNGVPRCLVGLSSPWPHHSLALGTQLGVVSIGALRRRACGVSQEEAVQHINSSTDLDLNRGCARCQMNDLRANAFLLLPSESLFGKQEHLLGVDDLMKITLRKYFL